MFDEHVDVFLSEQQSKLNKFLDECAARIRSGDEKPQRETHATAYPLPSGRVLYMKYIEKYLKY